MAKKQKRKVPELTASGFKYDQDLARVPIKVFPALQALIANQHDLMEIAQKHEPDNFIFLESHKSELAEVEESIAQAHSLYMEKKEKAKAKREEKKKTPSTEQQSPGNDFVINPEFGDYEPAVDTLENKPPLLDEPAAKMISEPPSLDELADDMISEPPSLDELAAKMSPGLPSAKYEPRKSPAPQPEEKPDIKRIAIGASIKALQGLLKRELTEEEITAIEKEIDSYL